MIHRWPIFDAGNMGKKSVSGYNGRRFKPRLHKYVVSLSKTLNPHYFSGVNCEMRTNREHPRERLRALSFPDEMEF